MTEEKKRKVDIYDTTLRDGTQGEDINFTVSDKIRIAHKLDELGIDFIEGGWPGSNPKDMEFFSQVKKEKFSHARIASFGSTRRADRTCETDENIQMLVQAETPVITIFGKSWDLHVEKALKIPLEENLELIYDSISYLKKHADVVFYDAEHFFDGYKNNPEYALKTIKAAEEAGADCIVLADTNGGTLPFEIEEIVNEVKKHLKAPFGAHMHNDSETAVANSLMLIHAGGSHVQGTINGFGERCGNANLISIIPAIMIKMGLDAIPWENLKKLREVSRFVNEIANLPHDKHQPYVGQAAFAHKGGVHVNAVRKDPRTYEHIDPELVGNHRRVLLSDLSGKSNILYKAEEFGIDISKSDERTRHLVQMLKEMEYHGYQFEGAEASFELLMRKFLGEIPRFFKLRGFRVIDEKRSESEPIISEATVMIEVEGKKEHTAALGNGPVNALDNALRKALISFYPSLKEIKLKDYKVRVLTAEKGTAASVRVLIESGDEEETWGTVGVSENIIEASYNALVDSINYKLFKDRIKKKEEKEG